MTNTIHYVLMREGVQSEDDIEAVEVYEDKDEAVDAWKNYVSDEYDYYFVIKAKNWFTDEDEWLEIMDDENGFQQIED